MFTAPYDIDRRRAPKAADKRGELILPDTGVDAGGIVLAIIECFAVWAVCSLAGVSTGVHETDAACLLMLSGEELTILVDIDDLLTVLDHEPVKGRVFTILVYGQTSPLGAAVG